MGSGSQFWIHTYLDDVEGFGEILQSRAINSASLGLGPGHLYLTKALQENLNLWLRITTERGTPE